MATSSLAKAFLEIIKVFRKFVYLNDQSGYLVLGLFTLLTHCFRCFDAIVCLLITGPYNSGKTLILEILNFLCCRSLLASQISRAAFYHVVNRLKGTLIIDEVEDLSRLRQSGFDMAVLLHGYKRGGYVVRVDAAKRRPIKFDCFGPKVLANTGGIASKQLKSRCIVIKTVHADREMDRFLKSREEKALKELASGIAALFKRKTLVQQIIALNEEIKPPEGLSNRDFELWVGMLIIARLIDLEVAGLNLYERIVKIAIAITEKRDEESFFGDWNIRVLISVMKYFTANTAYNNDTFIQADKLTAHVIEELRPSFSFRTEGLGKTLDRESLLLERKVMWFKDDQGRSIIHKTGWRVDVVRLKNRVKKYEKYTQSEMDCPDPDVRSAAELDNMLEKDNPDSGNG